MKKLKYLFISQNYVSGRIILCVKMFKYIILQSHFFLFLHHSIEGPSSPSPSPSPFLSLCLLLCLLSATSFPDYHVQIIDTCVLCVTNLSLPAHTTDCAVKRAQGMDLHKVRIK